MLYLIIAEGADPETARPLIATQDREVLDAVGRALARRLEPRDEREGERPKARRGAAAGGEGR